jgi:hypothetical protein
MKRLIRIALPLLACAAAALAQTNVVLDNDQVRILKVTVPTDHTTGFHVHTTNRVMVYLNKGGQSIIRQDGPTTVQKWKAGEPLWSPAIGMHRVVLAAKEPNTIVEIELKQPAPATPAAMSRLHPLNADPKHNKLEFENDQVWVYRTKYKAGDDIPTHEHQNPRISTYLTASDTNDIDGAGVMTHTVHEAGDIAWSVRQVRHHAKAQRASETVVVELK